MIADANKRSDAGDTRCWQTDQPPAGSPKMVTRDGSPPKAIHGVALRPLHRKALVVQAVVAKRAAAAPAVRDELAQREPAERVEIVVGGDDHDAVFFGQGGAVVIATGL